MCLCSISSKAIGLVWSVLVADLAAFTGNDANSHIVVPRRGRLGNLAPGLVNSAPSRHDQPVGAPSADLSISMILSTPSKGVQTGSNITHTITVRNNGPDAASDVSVYDDIPVGTSFVSAKGNYSVVSGGATGTRLIAAIGTLPRQRRCDCVDDSESHRSFQESNSKQSAR